MASKIKNFGDTPLEVNIKTSEIIPRITNNQKMQKEISEIKVNISDKDIEKEKISQKNSYMFTYKEYSAIISRTNETVYSITNGILDENGSDFLKKCNLNIQKYTELLSILQKNITDLNTKILDNKILTELTERKIKIESDKIKEKYIIIEREIILKNKKKENIAKEKKIRLENKSQNYEYKRAFNYYENVCSSVPEYMKKNLKEMPRNKGYIFRGVYFYGELPSHGNEITMFERIKDNLFIHEWTSTNYKVFKKYKKEPKILVKIEDRRKFNSSQG